MPSQSGCREWLEWLASASGGTPTPATLPRNLAEPRLDYSLPFSRQDWPVRAEVLMRTRAICRPITLVRFVPFSRIGGLHPCADVRSRNFISVSSDSRQKQLLSASASAAHALDVKSVAAASALHAGSSSDASAVDSDKPVELGQPDRPRTGPHLPTKPTAFIGYRITNPTKHPVSLHPPFQQVMVQSIPPVPGQVYNLLSIAVKNGTSQTFTASNNFVVRLPGGKTFPVLTGSEVWKPRTWIVFYAFTKEYYPLRQIPGGFEFDFGGRITTLVPGPSAIFLRLKYNPATFVRTLNWIIAYGQGAVRQWATLWYAHHQHQQPCRGQGSQDRFRRTLLIDVRVAELLASIPISRGRRTAFSLGKPRLSGGITIQRDGCCRKPGVVAPMLRPRAGAIRRFHQT